MFRVVICILLFFIYMSTVVDQLPRLGKRELICLLLLTCNYVVSVRKGFLWVLGMGYVILLWHSLSLSYNYFNYYPCTNVAMQSTAVQYLITMQITLKKTMSFIVYRLPVSNAVVHSIHIAEPSPIPLPRSLQFV